MRKALFILAIALLGCYAFYKWYYPTYFWNQKLTIEIEVGGQIVSGSSVTRIVWWRNFFSGGWGGAHMHTSHTGEAVVVDLGERGVLFAPLAHQAEPEYISDLAMRSIYDRSSGVRTAEAFQRVKRLRGPIDVPRKFYPLIVIFEDLGDPASVRRVDPDNLVPAIGSGTKISSVTLEITNEAPTEGPVRQRLAWLDEYYDKLLDGNKIMSVEVDKPVSNSLGAGSFASRRRR